MPLTILRHIFQDYDTHRIQIPEWKEYAFHLSESSLRTVLQAEQKLLQITAGHADDSRTWRQAFRDLRVIYGVINENEDSINTLGREFLSYCQTNPSEFAKEFWLYHAHSKTTGNLKLRHNQRVRDFNKILQSTKKSRYNLFDSSDNSARILCFTEHLTPFPKALDRFLELPRDKALLVSKHTDSSFIDLMNQINPSDKLRNFISRVKTFDRMRHRRRYFIIYLMLIPIISEIEILGRSTLRIHSPFHKYFSFDEIVEQLKSLGYSPYIFIEDNNSTWTISYL